LQRCIDDLCLNGIMEYLSRWTTILTQVALPIKRLRQPLQRLQVLVIVVPPARSSTSGVGKIYFTKLTIAALAASVWDLFAYYHTSIFDEEYEKIISCLAVRVLGNIIYIKRRRIFLWIRSYDRTWITRVMDEESMSRRNDGLYCRDVSRGNTIWVFNMPDRFCLRASGRSQLSITLHGLVNMLSVIRTKQ
jgi:hypothetical protein